MTDTQEAPVSPDVEGYDFFDFGCSTGGNITFTARVMPGLRGLGIDIDPAKISAALENGHHAVVYDILKLPNRPLVEFVTMSHFLEHLPGIDLARRMIGKAVSVSREFVFVRQPWFDSDGELMRHGLKFYWSHWHGHRNKMTTLDFHSILKDELDKGRIAGFSLYGRGPIAHSRSPALLPLGAPVDQHDYQAALHGPKEQRELPFTAYREIVARIDLRDGTGADAMAAGLGRLDLLFAATRKGNEVP